MLLRLCTQNKGVCSNKVFYADQYNQDSYPGTATAAAAAAAATAAAAMIHFFSILPHVRQIDHDIYITI